MIEKRYRKSPLDTFTISVYYIVFNTIFQANTLKKLIDSKTQNAGYLINKAFEMIKENANILYTESHHSWKHLKKYEKIDYDLVF